MTQQIVLKDPADLTIHPAKKSIIDDWGKEDSRYIALVEDIRERGIDTPLLVDSENRVIEGRRRLRSARQLQLAEVPCIVRAGQDVFGIVLSGLVQRGHYCASQLAYLTYPLMESAFAESRQKRLQNLKKGQQSPESPASGLSGKKIEDFADHIGISRALFFDAQKVHKLFAEHAEKRDLTDKDGNLECQVTFKSFYEQRILRQDDPYGLGAVVAGISASIKCNGAAKGAVPKQLDLFKDSFETVGVRLRYWPEFAEGEKKDALGAVRETFAMMPDDLLAGIQRVIKEVKKQRRSKVKKGE